MTNNLATIEEIIEDAKNGKMFILVDDEDRENEGDLIIPAELCDDKAVNFMAKYGRGLICLALSSKRVEQLSLPSMAMDNKSRNKTAFTVSIEAVEGISTGISAHDRATTIKDAIDPNKGQNDIVSPGHVFPLRAQDGGVLVRAGHTEAAVDISKLAGLNPSGVICEIMNEDGTMARLPDLLKFAQQHQLKVATIADLIEHRRKNEKLIEVVKEDKLISEVGGEFEMIFYKSKIDGVEHIVLKKGDINTDEETLVRMHHINILSDCLDNKNDKRKDVLNKSLKKIANNNGGVLVLIRQPNEIISNLLPGSETKTQTLINYGTGAQILNDLGVKNMRLLTNSKKSIIGLDGYGLSVCGYENLD